MDTNGHQDLHTFVASLRGLRCWYISTGGAAGSTFKLALGSKVPRLHPLKNPAHSDEYRQFEGEANLLVWCAWRLDGPNGPLTSWDDGKASVVAQLGKLVGRAIDSVVVVAPAWDLTVGFSDGFILRVFCDHVPGDPSFDGNWDLSRQEVAVSVGPGSEYVFEMRNDPVSPHPDD